MRPLGERPLVYLRRKRLGFSLIEVVVASAIFAVSIVAVVGLIGPMSQRVGDVVDTEVSAKLAGAIESEMQRIGFARITGDPDVSDDAAAVLAANSGGTRVLLAAGPDPEADHPLNHPTLPGIAMRDRYFRVRLVLAAPFDPSTSSAVFVRADVAWPLNIPTGPANPAAVQVDDDLNYTEIPVGQRRTLSYFFAVRR